MDEVAEDGAKVQMSGKEQLTVQRPRQLHLVVKGDAVDREVWFDGKQVVMADHREKAVSRIPLAAGA